MNERKFKRSMNRHNRVKIKPWVPVAFVIPVFRTRRSWLNVCLQSLTEQMFAPALVVIVNDKPGQQPFWTNRFFKHDVPDYQRKTGIPIKIVESERDTIGGGHALNVGLKTILECRDQCTPIKYFQNIGSDDWVQDTYLWALKSTIDEYNNIADKVKVQALAARPKLEAQCVEKPNTLYNIRRLENPCAGIKSFDMQYIQHAVLQDGRHIRNKMIWGNTQCAGVYDLDAFLTLRESDVSHHNKIIEGTTFPPVKETHYQLAPDGSLRWREDKARNIDGPIDAVYGSKYRMICIPPEIGRWYVYRIHDSNISHDANGNWKGDPDDPRRIDELAENKQSD